MIEAGSQDLDFLDRQPVAGERLSDRLAMGPLSAEEALQYAVEIGAALNKAHMRGLVHGYLCPHLISLTANGAVVLAPPAYPLAESAPYRAPEQVRGEQPDTRSDVFAFGAIVYEMAAGTRAFPGEGQTLSRSILQDPTPTLTLRSPVYDAMASVIAGCLEKSPAARRQRIQNAVIELRFASRNKPRTSFPRPVAPQATAAAPAPAQPEHPAPAGDAPPTLPPPPRTPPVKARPTEPPRVEQFLFRPGEPVPRMRAVPLTPGWRELFGAGGKLSLQGFRFRLIAFMALCLLVVVGGAVGAVMYFRPKPSAAVMRFAVSAPEHTAFPGSPAVSPDGRNLAFSATGPEGKRTLWLRPLDAIRSTPIAGTEGGTNPFWSPDGQYLAYFAARSLRVVRLKDLATETICKVEGMNGGGAWNKDGTILFSRGPDDGLYRVNAKPGSTPVPVLKVNSTKNETGYLWPNFLPDDKHFIFYVQTDAVETTGVYGGTLDPSEYHMLFASETNAIYSALPDSQKNGYLLYIQGRKLMGQGFNAPRMGLAGEPMTLHDDIGAVRSLSLAPISVANNATLVYQTVGKATRRLMWVDRNGNELSEVGEAGDYGPARISHDGRRAVVARLGPTEEAADLWTVDPSGKGAQFTFTSGTHEGSPVWSPDGSKIAMFLRGKAEGNYDLYVMPVDGGKSPDLLFRSSVQKAPTDWSRDGRYILFNSAADSTKWDVWAVSTADRHAGPILDTVHSERDAVLSPDGKWLAFDSDESGRMEVYVQAFTGINSDHRKRWKLSAGGGATPKWSADGKEIYYITGSGRIMAAAVHASGDDFETDAPVKLFQTRPVPKTWNLFESSPDGQRFLVNLPLEWNNSSQIMVMTNWTEKLKD